MADVFEGKLGGKWRVISESVFRSFPGPRRKNGLDYVGPCYWPGSDDRYDPCGVTKLAPKRIEITEGKQ